MKRFFSALFLLTFYVLTVSARNIIYDSNVKSLVVTVNQQWMSPPVMIMGNGDRLNISFDELSHTYHRYIYKVEHCEADWTVSSQLFESDYMTGFNNNPIDDYQNSINTTVLYTHYKLTIPNEQCRLTMSGNYRLTIYDEDNDGKMVLQAEFMIVEPRMTVGLEVSTNTDIDTNDSHQQLSMSLNYNGISVTNINEQIRTVVMQNNDESTSRWNLRPNLINNKGLAWQHNRDLIFKAGNEYHKFEALDVSHPTLGIDYMRWDGHNFNAYLFPDEVSRNYLTDVDADGAFFIRNSDNSEIDYTCEYLYIHYKLKAPRLSNGDMYVEGHWTTDNDIETYKMEYDATDGSYNVALLQKQGYYNYRYVVRKEGAAPYLSPYEGSYFQTENRYQAYVYYKPTGGRTWFLLGFREIILK